MNLNDRLALELGRALLRAVAAEEKAAQLEAQIVNAQASTAPDETDKT